MKVKDLMLKLYDDQKVNIHDYLFRLKNYFTGIADNIPLDVQELTIEQICIYNDILILKVSNS